MLPGVAAGILALAFVTEAGAEDRAAGEFDDVLTEEQRDQLLPLEKILAIAKQQIPGDVIDVELEFENGLVVYEITVLAPNGRVREIELDARTGKVLEIEDD
ncbi:MAG: PepSY domain-containing protein [Steroidobacteraceae bacterium]